MRQDEPQSTESGIRRGRPTFVTWMAYVLRVAQLLGVAGLAEGAFLWLKSESTLSPRQRLLFCAASFLVAALSTLALGWLKGEYPQTTAKAIQSADKKWDTPLEERHAKIWIVCIVAVVGAIVLWMSISMW
jgi:hypothetical protein